jgi:hypothetical protein
MELHKFPKDIDMSAVRRFVERALGDLGCLSDPLYAARHRKVSHAVLHYELAEYELREPRAPLTRQKRAEIRTQLRAEYQDLLSAVYVLALNAAGWLHVQDGRPGPDPLGEYLTHRIAAASAHFPAIAAQYTAALAVWRQLQAAQPDPPLAEILTAAGQLTFAGV